MALFGKESQTNRAEISPERRPAGLTREKGTRNLVLGFVLLLLLGYLGMRIQDHFLLQRRWPPLKPDVEGLTVIGTLDARGDYERNFFRILQIEGQSRAELTDFGWRSIFNPENGRIFDSRAEGAITNALSTDGAAGYAMLEPYLRYGVSRLLDPDQKPYRITPEQMITAPANGNRGSVQSVSTLGALLKKYGEGGAGKQEPDQDAAESEGGSESSQQTEKGTAIPASTLIQVCPVVLTGKEFQSASLEDQPETAVGGKAYTIHLDLTPEGRSRFYQWSYHHANENLVYVLKNEVIVAGRIQQTLDVDELEITNVPDRTAAMKLVDFINHQAGR